MTQQVYFYFWMNCPFKECESCVLQRITATDHSQKFICGHGLNQPHQYLFLDLILHFRLMLMHLDFSFDSLHLTILYITFIRRKTEHSVQLNVGEAFLSVFIFFSWSSFSCLFHFLWGRKKVLTFFARTFCVSFLRK